MLSRLSSSNILSNGGSKHPTATKSTSNASLTLPITCQICLGKIRDPSVCPNLHVFCSSCLEIWLEKSKHCPTCRVEITKENPTRRILGGLENTDEDAADLLKPCEFSHAAFRKARYLDMFRQYEDEIARLNELVDSLNADIANLKETNSCGKSFISASVQPSFDQIQSLNAKLHATQSALAALTKERNSLRENNKRLESENSILIQDTMRLKASLNEKSSQISNRYTLGAMESKLEGYEKEIKQLQKALEKSDKYIADLEARVSTSAKSGNKENHHHHYQQQHSDHVDSMMTTTSFTSPPPSSSSSSSSASTINNNATTTSNRPGAPAASHTHIHASTADKFMPSASFYGSPSKHTTTPNKEAHSSSSTTVSSFAERMRKNATAASVTNSNNNTVNNSGSNSFFIGCHPTLNIEPAGEHGASRNMHTADHHREATQQHALASAFLFSPMKRLRLEEEVEASTRRAINFNQVAVESDMSNEVANNGGGSLLFRSQQVSNDLLNLEELLCNGNVTAHQATNASVSHFGIGSTQPMQTNSNVNVGDQNAPITAIPNLNDIRSEHNYCK